MNSSAQPLIHVQIGKYYLGYKGEQLCALLGSCIGIALLWPKRQTFGLAHCLLPKEPSNEEQSPGARYVNQAIRTLIQEMGILPIQMIEVKAVIAGGANMTSAPQMSSQVPIGQQNSSAAEKIVSLLGITVSRNDTGGTLGRNLYVNCLDGSFNIATIQPAPTKQKG